MSAQPLPLPLWLKGLLLLGLAAVLFLQLGPYSSDQGVNNALSYPVGALPVGALLLWWTLFSRRAALPRLAPAAVLFTAGFTGLTLFEFTGFTGTMVPTFRSRARAIPEPVLDDLAGLEGPDGQTREPIDLTLTSASDFPGFLGPQRDGSVRGVRLARSWSESPPVELWRRPVGAGWSGFASVNGVAVTLEQREGSQVAVAYGVADGEVLWSNAWQGRFDHLLGGLGPRSTPTVAEGQVILLGAHGRLRSLSGETGQVSWEVDLLEAFGITPEDESGTIQYGRSNSPLVLGDQVIVPVGGPTEGPQHGLVSFDLETGNVNWKGPAYQPSFASPTVARLLGEEVLLVVNEDTVTAHRIADGTLLWEHPWPGVTSANANVSQAHGLEGDRVLVSKGYGQGSEMFQVYRDDQGQQRTRTLWASRRALRTKLTNLVRHGEYAYGLSDGILECVELSSGERIWRSGRYGHGQILLVEDLLLVMGEMGTLYLVEPDPETPDLVLGELDLLEGKCWNHLCVTGNVALLRSDTEAVALELPLRE